MLFEYVFGIRTDALGRKIEWTVRRTERHGILRLPVGGATVDVICQARENEDTEPQISVVSDAPVTVTVKWRGGEKTVHSAR